MLHAVGQTEFDHAVVMVRDRLDALAPHFERQGFHLSDKAVHNLGSCNRLIVLEGTYVELLGWPPGAPPARKEIADSPFG
ncbi:VOC family protein, partial [Paraburkholderia sp. SIMBA_009]